MDTSSLGFECWARPSTPREPQPVYVMSSHPVTPVLRPVAKRAPWKREDKLAELFTPFRLLKDTKGVSWDAVCCVLSGGQPYSLAVSQQNTSHVLPSGRVPLCKVV